MTAYTLDITDAAKLVTISNASAIALTVPPNSAMAFPIGTKIEGLQKGAGQVTLTPGAGVTLSSRIGLKTAGQYSRFLLTKIATDIWVASGDLTT